jgi:hypothetical protein
MSFDYASPSPAGQTPITPAGKGIFCKSFRIDLAETNRGTGVAFDLGWLPQNAQIVGGLTAVTTAVSGPSVSAATLQITVNSASVWNTLNVFAIGTSAPNNAGYFNLGLNPTADQKIIATLTLTGGATATGGRIYINLFYVN